MSTTRDRYENKAYKSSRDAARAEHYAMDMRDARAEILEAVWGPTPEDARHTYARNRFEAAARQAVR